MIFIFIGILLFLESFISFKNQTGAHRIKHLMTNIFFLIPSKLISISFFYFIDADFFLFGFFNHLNLNVVQVSILSIVTLDFCLWVQHLYSHKIELLWRLHKVHHSDLILDVSSAARFHPIEILLSLSYKLLIVYVFGISKENYFLFESITIFCALFTHSNVKLNRPINTATSIFIITPNLHQIHHSNESNLMNSNFGNFLSIWDRIFNYFVRYEEVGKLTIGLKDVTKDEALKFDKLLKLPFKKG